MESLPIHYAEVEAMYNQTIGRGYKTLAITSSISGEGKSTITQAIVERAQIVGKKILLVEMNTLNPSLSNSLRESLSIEVIENKVSKIMSKGYSIVAAPQNIQDILQFREDKLLRNVIQQWLQEFDVIIFDTSAVTALNQNNIPAEIICGVCEAALLVVEAGKTPSNLIKQTVDKLTFNKVNLVGSVINDRYNPSLLTELQRETYRFDGSFPSLMTKIRNKLASSVLLNISV